jgi:hypothetical protein
MDTLTNRLTWNVKDVPGLNLSVSDTRNLTHDATGASTRNDTTQYALAYSVEGWNANLTLGTGNSSSSVNSLADGQNEQIQLSLGRNWAAAQGDAPTD